MSGYRLTRRAEADLAAIARYTIDQHGAAQAIAYRDALLAILEFLVENPRAARERREIDPPVRVHPFKAHLIVYRIDTDGSVLVLRIPHGREDWQSGPAND